MKLASEINLLGLHILVVEDDPASSTLISRILGKCGAVVDTANNGGKALAMFEEKRYPIIVTDICMPNMDGLELVARIRQFDKNAQIIATSANRETGCLISAIELGFNDYFLKPLEIEKLMWAVKRCADTVADRQRLEDEQQKFRTVVECLGEGLTIKDLDYRIVYQNSAMTDMFGDHVGKPCFGIFGLEAPCDGCPTVMAMENGNTHSSRRTCRIGGKTIHIESTASLLRNARGLVTGSVEIIRDISARVKTEHLIGNIAKGVSAKVGAEYLTSLTSYLTEALEMDYAMVGELKEDGLSLQALAFSCAGSPAELFTYDLNCTPCAVAIDSGIQVFPDNVAKLFPEASILNNLSIQSYCGAPLIDSKGVAIGILCTFNRNPIENPELVSDIIRIFASRAAAELERLRNEQTIRDMAFHDPLTGLANRRLFEDRLTQSIAKARRNREKFGLIYLDLDRFKQINDTFGHETGDQVLIITADRIRQCCRRNYDTISRHGGDEFFIIIEEINGGESLAEIAESLCHKIGEPLELVGRQLRTSTSIGISVYPDDGEEPMELEMAADRAMYSAKQSGRDTFRYAAKVTEEKHPA